ncbi:MAG: serine hydrolase domain-containing protein [Lysobacter sp.]
MLLACLAILPSHASTDADGKPRVERMLKEEGLTGAAWMLLTPNDGIVTDAAGLRHAGMATPVSAEDRFQVGSIAKTVIATGVLRLVTQQRLALDTPVQQILPEIRWTNPWNDTHPVLLRHLLDHTAGLEDAGLRHVLSGNARPDSPLSEVFGRGPTRVTVRTRPGDEYSYSNIGYVLVAMVIERVVGQRYETYLDTNLLQPLDMASSTFAYTPQASTATPPLAMGHVDGGVPQSSAPTHLRAAGQLLTTARDMGAFARFLLGNGMVDGDVFIDAPLLRQMGRARDTVAAKAGLEASYALGIWRRDRHGVVGLCHEGTTVGFRALLCLYPHQKKAFFIGFNMDSESADYGVFDALMIEQLAIPKSPIEPAIATKDELGAWMGWYGRVPGKVPAFEYVDLVFNPVSIASRGGGLVLHPLFSDAVELTALGGMRFRATGRSTASHVLLIGEWGPEWSNGFSTYRQVDRWVLFTLWFNLALGLAGVLYVLAAGGWRLLHRASVFRSDPLAPAWLAVLGIPLAGWLVGQSWQRMGDLTMASGLLAFLTAVLPIAAVFGLWRVVRHKGDEHLHRRRWDAWMLLAVLQWCAVLAVWGMLPLRTWA